MRTNNDKPASTPLEPRQRAVLAGLVAGATLTAAIFAYGALDGSAAVATTTHEPDFDVHHVTLAIDVRTADLPRRKPSFAAARAIDEIERAEVVAAAPQAAHLAAADDLPADLNHSGAGEPALAIIDASGAEIWVSAFASPRRMSVLPTASRNRPHSDSADEDLTSARKRIFAGDR